MEGETEPQEAYPQHLGWGEAYGGGKPEAKSMTQTL